MKTVALILLGTLFGGILSASAREPGNVLIIASRKQCVEINLAANAIEDGRFSEGVTLLGAILARTGDESEDDSLMAMGDSQTFVGLRGRAERILGEMSAEGRKQYELVFGSRARDQLNRAVSSGDFQLVRDVKRRYFHTQAGYEATMLLGSLQYDQGRPLAAALSFQKILTWPSARQRFEPQLSVRLAFAWMQAGLEDKALETLINLRSRQPDAILRIAGKPVALYRRNADALTWLRQFSRFEAVGPTDESAWLMHKGNAQRNAVRQGNVPPLNCRWRQPVVSSFADEPLLVNAARNRRDEDVTIIPSLQFLAFNGVVLLRTPDEVLGVDLQSGKRIWSWAPSSPSVRPQDLQITKRVFDDASFGRMSSDGENLYLLTDLGGASMRELDGQTSLRRHNQLVSLSLRREGAFRWNIGGCDGGIQRETATAFFLGPPLPIEDRLYVLAEIRREIRLLVLDPRDGTLIWQQLLAEVSSENTIDQIASRRLMGASHSFANGVLICPTGVGAVVAVDISTQSPLWGYQYETNQQQAAVECWIDASPTIIGNHVLLTPPESGQLHCLNLVSGEPQWSPVSRDDMLYAAGAMDEIAMVVGKHSVRGIQLSDGKLAWETVNLSEHQPGGFGFLSNGHYFLPMSNREVLKITIKNGEVAQRIPTNFNVGNLVCYGDSILSHGASWFSCFEPSAPPQMATNPNHFAKELAD